MFIDDKTVALFLLSIFLFAKYLNIGIMIALLPAKKNIPAMTNTGLVIAVKLKYRHEDNNVSKMKNFLPLILFEINSVCVNKRMPNKLNPPETNP